VEAGIATEQFADHLREVQVEFVNPFLSALNQTLQSMGRTTASKGSIRLTKINIFSADALIFMRIDGAIKGIVILELPEEIAKKFVSQFLLGVPIIELDEMARNSLIEFSIRISEKAKGRLVQRGYLSNVSSNINFYKPLQFSRDRQFIVVPLNTEFGSFNVFFHVMKTDVIERRELPN